MSWSWAAAAMLASCLCLCAVPRAHAVTILLKGQDQPLHGYLVSADETRVVVRIANADGTWKEQSIARSQIDVFHQPVDSERLASLDPSRPKEYRDYAEELAEKRVDPEARDASLRLFHIAAYLDPAGLGRGALLGMSGLARSPAEADRFHAAAFLLDPAHDPRLLVRSAKAAQPVDMSVETRALWRALELLRKGHHFDANQLGRRPGMEQMFAPYEDILPQAEFLSACEDRARRAEPPGPLLTAKILRVERRISAELLKIEVADSRPSADWSALPRQAVDRTARPVQLENLTEFDPRANVFRDGRWQAP